MPCVLYRSSEHHSHADLIQVLIFTSQTRESILISRTNAGVNFHLIKAAVNFHLTNAEVNFHLTNAGVNFPNFFSENEYTFKLDFYRSLNQPVHGEKSLLSCWLNSGFSFNRKVVEERINRFLSRYIPSKDFVLTRRFRGFS